MDSVERNKAVVREFDDITTVGGDLRRLDDLCTPDMTNHALAPGRSPGLEGTREFLRFAGREKYPARWVSSVVVAEGNFVVQFGLLEGHWPGGPFRGIDAPAGGYTRDVAFVYRLDEGRIAERWAIRDDLAMLMQLGVVPATTP